MQIYFRSADVRRVWENAIRARFPEKDRGVALRFSPEGHVQMWSAAGGSHAKAHAVAGFVPGILPTDVFTFANPDTVLSSPFVLFEIRECQSGTEADRVASGPGDGWKVSGRGQGQRWSVMGWRPAHAIEAGT